ncbi:rhamnogalacturonan acetylesterase [Halalkalibacter hemicellulosilyticus]|uniref:Rhamnogalacturonan acetylesterase n=1 Tax=Halalkalibacter hemicellulosilyticusJCM 9152 TaxID=1236971 RepID=W4QFL8_9BACI|nr:rhamnogalacturonan acetylesterase [Halalkalibacter hemicellulosilyticus]GAE30418.1 rhamnogalacturonan acetylesterase [Halalkalibacter hemicellulosilyticusJCM 9152]
MALLEGFELTCNNNVVFLSPDTLFSPYKGYGFLFNTPISNNEDKHDSYPGNYTLPFAPSLIIQVENGNYQMKITFGSDHYDSCTTIIAGAGQRIHHLIHVAKGQSKTMLAAVPVHSNELRLAFTGTHPAIRSIELSRHHDIRTIFLCGDSTVVNQPSSQYPYTGWGQFLPSFITEHAVISNHARSGRSTKSFIKEKRLEEVEKQLKKNDIMLIQFGHNDEKDNKDGTQPFTSYTANLNTFIHTAKKHGAHPILVTPIHRRKFDQNEKIMNTHDNYLQAMKKVATKQNVSYIDLAMKSQSLFERLGPRTSKSLFMWLEPSEFGFHPERVMDDTHFSELGAFHIARFVAEGLIEIHNGKYTVRQ